MMNEATAQKDADINAYITQMWDHYADDVRLYLIKKGVRIDEVDDLQQDTFVRFYSSLLRDHREQREREIVNIQAYLRRIAHFAYLNSLRGNLQRARTTVSSDYVTTDDEMRSILDLLPDPDYTPEEAVVRQERISDVLASLDQLSEQQQKVIRYTYFEGRPNREVAALLGLPLNVVSRLRLRGLRCLRTALFHASGNQGQLPEESINQTGDSTFGDISLLNPRKRMRIAPEHASAIARLPDPYRTVLTLAMLEGRKYAQIAALQHCPLGTVKGQISRGMHLLKTRRQPRQSPVTTPRPVAVVARELPYLDALPEHYRAILTLREIHGFSYDQIATHLQIPYSRVKKLLHRARTAHRALIDQRPSPPRTTSRRRSLPLGELPRLNQPSYRHFYEALYLAYVDHLSDEEIATRLHRPIGTIKAHLARGAKLLASLGAPHSQGFP